MHLVEFAIRNPVKVAVGVILLCIFGLLALLSIPVQLKPEVSKPTITVTTDWPGASPQEIEREIVDKQEEQLKSIEGMVDFKSESTDGRGEITMEFIVGIDMPQTLLKVGNKLDQVAEYPQDAEEPQIESVNTNDDKIAWLILQPLPPSHEELRVFIAEHPHLAEPLAPVLERETIELPRLLLLARRHPELKELLSHLPDTSLLRRFAEDEIEKRLERVPGVSNAQVIGGREQEMQVVVNPARLAGRGITIPQLRAALVGENKDISAGDIWDEKSRVVIRTLGQFNTPEQVEKVIVAIRDGAAVYVRDVAQVRLDYHKPDSIVRQMGLYTMAINAQRDPGANVLEVMDGPRGLKAAVREMNEGVLAARGLYLEQVYDETVYIRSATSLVRNNLLVGGALAVVVLLLFLRSGRSTLVVALTIPISVIGTFLVIRLFGRSINVISLAGMAFAVGMVVDAAIVVLENIFSHYQRGEKPIVAASRGTTEVWGAILASTLTTVAVFLPVVFVEEQAGQLFRDIAIAICAAVSLSLVVSVLVIPVAASRILRERQQHEHEADLARRDRSPLTRLAGGGVDAIVAMTERLQSGRTGRVMVVLACGGFLLGAMGMVPLSFASSESFPYVMPHGEMIGLIVAAGASLLFVPLAIRSPRLGIAASMIVLSVGLSIKIMPPREYLPDGNRNLVFGILLPPPGYNFDQMVNIGRQVEQQISPYWEVEPGSQAENELGGPALDHFFFVARGRSIFMGGRSVDPTRAGELVPVFQAVTRDVPGTITIASQASLFERGLQGGRTIDVEITGPDINKLIALGGQVFGQVRQMFPQDTTETSVQPVPSLDLGSPELHIRRNREKAAQRGVNTLALGYTINALVDGAYAGDYWHEGKKIDLVIMGDPRFSRRTEDVAALKIGTPTGEMVPLSAVTDITMSSGPEQINRIDRERAITIRVKPGPSIPLEVAMNRIESEVLAPLRSGGQLEGGLYHVRLAGTADDLKQMGAALGGGMVLAVLITYLLIAALYESFLYPLVIMVSVPMAAVGGFAGLRLLNLFIGQKMDTLTMLGFVILVGTVVNNAILIVNQALVNIRGEGMDHRTAVTDSVRGRIRPIFMSTATTVCGMLPLVVWPGAGSELYRGLGSVVLGGLVLSTVFTLVLVPMLFSLAYEAKLRLTGMRERSAPVLEEGDLVAPASRRWPK